MSKERLKILTVAGFDPSGGAGILADVKTFESNGCLGFAVITANTIQSEVEFLSPNWIDEDQVFEQLDVLTKVHQFEYVKIGLIPSLTFLKKLIKKLSTFNCKLIWDPILSASAGFDFQHDLSELAEVLKNIYLITPNWNEVKLLSGNSDAIEGAKELSKLTNVFLKGGHNEANLGKDHLFFEGETLTFNPKNKQPVYSKHGSGCVLSSAIAANFTKELPTHRVILKSKRYVERYLSSSKDLLGYHKI